MVSFNYANFRKDENGKTFLDLEIQAVFENQIIVIRNTFPATSNYQTCACQQLDIFLQNPVDNQPTEDGK
jgi:hypothetical protein